MKLFYDEVQSKRKNKTMRLQVGNEFQQVKIKDLNDQNNVETFTNFEHWRKAFAAEQKIRELKKRISKLKAPKIKISSTKRILRKKKKKWARSWRNWKKSPFQMEDSEHFSKFIG